MVYSILKRYRCSATTGASKENGLGCPFGDISSLSFAVTWKGLTMTMTEAALGQLHRDKARPSENLTSSAAAPWCKVKERSTSLSLLVRPPQTRRRRTQSTSASPSSTLITDKRTGNLRKASKQGRSVTQAFHVLEMRAHLRATPPADDGDPPKIQHLCSPEGRGLRLGELRAENLELAMYVSGGGLAFEFESILFVPSPPPGLGYRQTWGRGNKACSPIVNLGYLI